MDRRYGGLRGALPASDWSPAGGSVASQESKCLQQPLAPGCVASDFWRMGITVTLSP